MSIAAASELETRLKELHHYIREGRMIDAMLEFYDENVSMQENANHPTVGLQANIEREKQFLSGVKEWKDFEVKSVAVSDDVTFYEAVFDWIATDGTPIHIEQVARARWRNGKIVHEQFFYDTGGTRN